VTHSLTIHLASYRRVDVPYSWST